MKILIYISGIAGLVLTLAGMVSELYGKESSAILWISGLILVLGWCLPLLLYSSRKDRKRTDEIIRSYKNRAKKGEHIEHGKSQAKGWSINNSPFRKRKSGLSWGGGNIHAANASRGTRRGFMK